MINNAELTQIKERAEKATPGPWTWGGGGIIFDLININDTIILDSTDKYDNIAEINISEIDAEFIAHAREDVPRLIAEVERLNEVKHRLNSEVESYRKSVEIANANLSDAEAEILRLRSALEKITQHRVNHFPTRDRMVESMFGIAKEALNE